MSEAAAVIACVVLAGLTVFQLALVVGAPLGRFAWGGAQDVLPPRLRAGSAVAVVLYVLFALIILETAGLVAVLPGDALGRVGIWAIAVYFFLGAALNAVSRSKAERAVMTPIALVLDILCLFVALG
jgi:hypothetical protein